MREQYIQVNQVTQTDTGRASLFWLALGVGLIVVWWKVFLVLGLLGASGYCAYLAFQRRAADEQRLANRADVQNELAAEGNAFGVYGTVWNTDQDDLQPTMPAWRADHGPLS